MQRTLKDTRQLLPALVVALLALLATPACAGNGGSVAGDDAAVEASADTEAAAEDDEEEVELVGPVTRAEVEEAVPDWVAQQMESAPDPGAVQALAEVEPGAEVTVYLGTWCGDSKRELSRLWRGFDDTGVGIMGELPFDLEYVGVDGDKQEPADLLAGVDVEYVPTFVVRRGGEEVGRVVEISPNGIEHDLLALLTGEAAGVVSGREDLGGAGRDAILGAGEDEDGDEDGNDGEEGAGDDDGDGEGNGAAG